KFGQAVDGEGAGPSKFLVEGLEPRDLASIHQACGPAVDADKRLDAARVRLLDVARVIDLVVELDEHAPPAGTRARGGSDSIVKIARTVGADGSCRPHRTHHHHRLVAMRDEAEEVARF